MSRLKRTLMVASGALMLALPAAPVLAEQNANGSSGSSSGQSSSGGTSRLGSDSSKNEQGLQTARDNLKNKLDTAHLKVCKAREHDLDNRMQRITARGQKQLDLFTTIATRVENFYTTKGLSVSNYDSLVSDISAKKDAAQAAVNQVKSDSVSFNCDGTDPTGVVSTFKIDFQSETAALKAYRTSVKNLIMAVKTAAGDTSNASQ